MADARPNLLVYCMWYGADSTQMRQVAGHADHMCICKHYLHCQYGSMALQVHIISAVTAIMTNASRVSAGYAHVAIAST